MLKKLAKYGNSTTLVIDKAILELLNMDESSIVKLHTDGKSLIITPVAQGEGKKVSYENEEAMRAAKQAFEKKLVNQEISPETTILLQKEFAEVFKKHQVAFDRFNKEVLLSPDYQAALAQLSAKIDPATQHEEYLKELNKLRIQFCPEFEEFQKDIDAVYKKYHFTN